MFYSLENLEFDFIKRSHVLQVQVAQKFALLFLTLKCHSINMDEFW
jgi:hypothetical protein